VGGCGTGKSTFSMQYLYNGALKGEGGVYVSFEEDPEQIRENMGRFGWDLRRLEEQGKLRIVRIGPRDAVRLFKEDYGEIVDLMNDVKAQRVVVDSISSIELMLESTLERKENVLKFCDWLRKHDCTSIVTGESEQSPQSYSRHGVVEFAVDGVVVLYNVRKGNVREKALEVLKMRGTKHLTNIVPIVLDRSGVEVFPHEQVFGE